MYIKTEQEEVKREQRKKTWPPFSVNQAYFRAVYLGLL